MITNLVFTFAFFFPLATRTFAFAHFRPQAGQRFLPSALRHALPEVHHLLLGFIFRFLPKDRLRLSSELSSVDVPGLVELPSLKVSVQTVAEQCLKVVRKAVVIAFGSTRM